MYIGLAASAAGSERDRLTMLATIREFARERLAESGEAATVEAHLVAALLAGPVDQGAHQAPGHVVQTDLHVRAARHLEGHAGHRVEGVRRVARQGELMTCRSAPGERILDAGTGTGWTARRVAARGARVTGIAWRRLAPSW